MTDLHALQGQREDDSVANGMKRYARDVEERGLSVAAPGRVLRRKALKKTAEAIVAKLNGTVRPKPGAALVRGIDPYVLADLTMRIAIDGALRQETTTQVVADIGEAVEYHVRDAQFYNANKALWDKSQEKIRTTQSVAHRRRSVDGQVEGIREWAKRVGNTEIAAQLDDVVGLGWSNANMVDAGLFLLDCFAVTNLVTQDYIDEGPRQRSSRMEVVRFTEKTSEWLEHEHALRELERPMLLPMVIEPRPWGVAPGVGVDGGYLDGAKSRVPFLMPSNPFALPYEQHLDGEIVSDEAYAAVNRVQATPFRVNRAVFEVMHHVWKIGSGIGGVLSQDLDKGKQEVPELPPHALAKIGSRGRDVREDWKKTPQGRDVMHRRKKAHEFNALLRARVLDFARLMREAEKHVEFDAFWHVQKLDWRQRCYPVSTVLSPQGDQFNRGLIEFARGKRMGDCVSQDARDWLAIHGANTYGRDKLPFAERIKWVDDHEAEIIASAEDALENRFWTEADKPWPFLAFCFEWRGYQRDRDEHITHLPIGLDGSNSGLQHLSAMMRDVDGAKATNVTPNDRPADLYDDIAKIVMAELRKPQVDAQADEWADIWRRAGVTRKICKQPTMTYVYSATLQGMTEQIEAVLDELDAIARDHGRPRHLPVARPEQSNARAAQFLAQIVREAIKDRLPKAAKAMDFLVECARVASKGDHRLFWYTPAGIPVCQLYTKMKAEKRDQFIGARRVQLLIRVPADRFEEPDKVDKRRAAHGVSPNFVHSMDSTHMLWTVLACSTIADWVVVHDSFGSHATACAELAWGLRKQFHRLYSVNRLEEFRAQIAADLIGSGLSELAEELPPVPEQGDLDLDEVMRSAYFFA